MSNRQIFLTYTALTMMHPLVPLQHCRESDSMTMALGLLNTGRLNLFGLPFIPEHSRIEIHKFLIANHIDTLQLFTHMESEHHWELMGKISGEDQMRLIQSEEFKIVAQLGCLIKQAFLPPCGSTQVLRPDTFKLFLLELNR